VKEAKTIKMLFPLLGFYPWGIPIIIGLGLLSSLFEGLGISLFIPLLQSLEQNGSSQGNSNALIHFLNQIFVGISEEQRFIAITLCIFLSIVLKNTLSYSNGILFSWLNSHISHRLRSSIFQQLLDVSYGFLEQYESGKLINTLATETWQTSRALAVLVGLISNICTTTVFVVLLLLISWQLTLLVTVFMVGTSIAIQFLTRNVRQMGKQAVEVNALLTTRMWEGLTGMRVIRTFGREPYEAQRFNQASENVRTAFLRLDMLSGTVAPLSEVLAALLLLCILAIALLQDRTALPALLTFIFILYRLQPQVKQIDGARVGLVSLASSVEEVMSLLDRSNKPYIRSGYTPFRTLEQSISLEAVTFHYNPLETPALEDVSICIPKGKTTALVGPSGAGKSTLIGLICRLYEVSEGEIYVDGRPLRELELTSWRDRIAIVSQEVHMFSATVRENIAYGRLDATDAEIIAAAQQANAHDFIMQLPQGYETTVGDRGIRLSGGQRQRIALARAIVRDPEILILDEATNALDSIAEHLIQEALQTFGRDRTVIVIAHRLSTIEQADQIIVLQSGRVIEQGDMPHLLTLNGLFAQLYRLQYRNAQI
jgi:ATP-binding cassette, subfamily B, bacterial MsbA